MLEGGHDPRVVERNQRGRPQPPDERGDPDAADAHRATSRPRGCSPRGTAATPISEPAGSTSQHSSTTRITRIHEAIGSTHCTLPLGLAAQEREERREEMEDDQARAIDAPQPLRPAEVPGDLLARLPRQMIRYCENDM